MNTSTKLSASQKGFAILPLIIIIALVVVGIVTFNVTNNVTKPTIENVTNPPTNKQVNFDEEEDTDSTSCPKLSLSEDEDNDEEEDEEVEEEDVGCNASVHQRTWARHNFELAYLDTTQYKTSGNKDIKFNDHGWYAPSYSLPRSKLLDVNMNQKIKIKVFANMEGRLDTPEPDCQDYACITANDYPFAEFAIYFLDSRDSYEIKYGIALLGTHDRIGIDRTRDEFKFSWFSVENTGKEIIFEDSSDRKLVLDENSQTQHKLSNLNQDDEWRLLINSHVNGKGYTKLEIQEIQIMK